MKRKSLKRIWTEKDLASFREALRSWILEHNLSAAELEERLGYHSGGYLVHVYLGDLETSRAPSDPFVDALEMRGFTWEEELPLRKARKSPGVFALRDLPTGTLVVGEPVQCPECLAEAREGKRPLSQTWYVFPYGNQKYCCPAHRRAWYRRQRGS